MTARSVQISMAPSGSMVDSAEAKIRDVLSYETSSENSNLERLAFSTPTASRSARRMSATSYLRA